jgi:hypothetical protein
MEDALHRYDDGKPRYEGETKNGRMEGKGKYHFPNGNVYVGEFLNNAFHGAGTIMFPGSGKYEAVWTRGVASDGHYTFGDGLAYDESEWSYCTPGDRRFYSEHKHGISPAGNDQLTNVVDSTRILPRGCYDVVDGYLNPEDGLVYDWKHEVRLACSEPKLPNVCRAPPGSLARPRLKHDLACVSCRVVSCRVVSCPVLSCRTV